MSEVERPDLTARELAAHFNVSERTIQRHVENGMPHYKLGDRSIRFRLSEVEAWARRDVQPEPATAAAEE